MKSSNMMVVVVAAVVVDVFVVKDDGYIHSSIAAAVAGDTTFLLYLSIYIYICFFFSKISNQSYKFVILDSIDGLSRRVEK